MPGRAKLAQSFAHAMLLRAFFFPGVAVSSPPPRFSLDADVLLVLFLPLDAGAGPAPAPNSSDTIRGRSLGWIGFLLEASTTLKARLLRVRGLCQGIERRWEGGEGESFACGGGRRSV